MGSKSFVLFALFVLVVITSEVAARDLADTSQAHNDVKDVVGGGYPGGGGGGGYPGGGGGGHGGSYCHFGCCGRKDYYGNCLRCCGMASQAAVDAQVEVQPHN